MPTERELRQLLEAREGSSVPPPTVFAGDVSLCPVLNGSGGAGGSAALLQQMARSSGGAAGGAGADGAVIGYDKARAPGARAREARAGRCARPEKRPRERSSVVFRGRSSTALTRSRHFLPPRAGSAGVRDAGGAA
jgi:hypothetical protein